MKLLRTIGLSIILTTGFLHAQNIDTLINVGKGHKLHFTIIKGTNTPILFESGLGNGADVWKNITKQIADVTGAAIITYDRLSYGEEAQNYQIGFENELKALENGLQKLGFANKNIMLVSHSLGGMYSSYYASRHKNEVKAAVLFDVGNSCTMRSTLKQTEEGNLKTYLLNILDTVTKNPMPLDIPLIDIVVEKMFDDYEVRDTVREHMWLGCHKNFVSQSTQRKMMLAYGVGHHIFIDNPLLAINVIVKQYADFVEPKQRTDIIEKGYTLMANESNKDKAKCGRTESDLNDWGYALLGKNETLNAIEILKLTVILYPESWNAYDSLAEAYLKNGNKDLAIKNYKKSLELNPNNENATKVLKQIN